MNQLLLQYSYLQTLDLLTTIAFLVQGVEEANPIVRIAMRVAPTMGLGLIAVKMAALLLGFYCWRTGRQRTLTRINVLFALVVAWNLVAIIVSAAHVS